MFSKEYVLLKLYRYSKDKKIWEVNSNLTFTTKDSLEIVVTKGFKTDLASVPKLFYPIYPPFGKYSKAAILHDYLYQGYGYSNDLSRKECDKIFKYAMKCENVNCITRNILYISVRLFGFLSYKKA